MENKGNSFDVLIVGQGIAGTMLCYFLQKTGKKVLVVDDQFEGSSSMVAAGIINPITGKRFTLSWNYEKFLPVAIQAYDELSDFLGIQCYEKSNIIRALYSTEEENNWLARTADDLIAPYICNSTDPSEFKGVVNEAFSYGEVSESFHVNFKSILTSFRKELTKQNAILNERFDYDALISNTTGFEYKDYDFKQIVFCEGYQAQSNPFFKIKRLAPAKGEVLLVKIPSASFHKMYKDRIFIVHQYDDVYWAGLGYEWEFDTEKPTKEGYDKIYSELKRVLKVSFEVVDHIAGIRPTMLDRRPVFLIHDEIKEMYLFNGLGTKGASISPYLAKQFARYIVNKDPEDAKIPI